MLNASRQWLMRLIAEGSLPASSVPKAAKAEIDNVKNAGFIRWEKSGAGAKFFVSDESALSNLLQSTGYQGDIESLTPKARAVALHGDAHKGQDDTLMLVLSASENAQWSDGENTLDVSDLVEKFGVASLVVKPGDNWCTNQTIGLVENIDLVLNGKAYCEQIGFDGVLLYYSGWISKKLRHWLTQKKRSPRYVVLPDYDIVGLKNYLLAKEKLGEETSIYVPENITELLLRFGNTDKLKSKSARKLIEASSDQDVIYLYNTLLETGRGLDQESLLLSVSNT